MITYIVSIIFIRVGEFDNTIRALKIKPIVLVSHQSCNLILELDFNRYDVYSNTKWFHATALEQYKPVYPQHFSGNRTAFDQRLAGKPVRKNTVCNNGLNAQNNRVTSLWMPLLQNITNAKTNLHNKKLYKNAASVSNHCIVRRKNRLQKP